MSLKKVSKWQARVTVVVFCILIFGFTITTILKPTTEFSETENRVLTKMPELKTDEILNGKFESNYEEYLTDQFVLRDNWIGLKTSVEKMMLKKESKDIYFAEDGYLIEKHTGSFTSDMARRNIAELAQFAKKYQEQFGSEHMSVMIAPNAVDILTEKLPPFATPYDEEDYLGQIAKELPDDIWFDTTKILREHTREDIYYRTDHHWKTLAAFYVYQQWAKEKGYDIPDLTDYEIKTVTSSFEGTIQSKLGIKTVGDTIELFLPKADISYTVQRDNSKEIKDSLYDYSALDTKDKYAIYFGGNQALLQIRTKSDSQRKILVIKDSYANCFIPFMLGEFQEIDVLDIRYTNRKLSEFIAEGEYTDLLVLHNASGFAEDISITKLTN